MPQVEIEIILQGGKEKHPEAKPRTSPTTGPSSSAGISRSSSGSRVDHVRTSPYYPQFQRKIERCTNHSKENASGRDAV